MPGKVVLKGNATTLNDSQLRNVRVSTRLNDSSTPTRLNDFLFCSARKYGIAQSHRSSLRI